MIEILLGSRFDKTGFDKAQKSLKKTGGGVDRLAKQFLGLFAAGKVYQFGKNAAKAFIEDQAATAKLTNSLKNLGLAFATTDVQNYVDKLTLATGVADDKLRPALQSLLQVTGSVTKSQKMLALAIDVSRGSSQDLGTVTNDLSQAYVGNLKGLRKYNLGLTKAELAASSFTDIQARLNQLFTGSSKAYLATYAGQMEVLTNTSSEAKEMIGKGLVDALVLVSGQNGVKGLSDDMLTLASRTSEAIYGIGVLGAELNKNKFINFLGKISIFGQINTLISELGKVAFSDKAKKGEFNFASGGGAGVGSTKSMADIAAAKAEKLAAARAAELAKSTKATVKAQKEALAIKKASGVFDMAQIQIIAALKGKLTAEERTRLEAQYAILTGNADLANKLTKEILQSQDATGNLLKMFNTIPNANNPFEYLNAYLDMLAKKAAALGAVTTSNPYPEMVGATPYDPRNGNPAFIDYNAMIPKMSGAEQFNQGLSGGLYGSTAVNVYVAGSVTSENDLVSAVAAGLQNQSLSGSPINIQRRNGLFG